MSTSTPTPQGTAPEPRPGTEEEGDNSRSLFAELDALLERMLALPVSYREEPDADNRTTPPSTELPPLITIAEAMPEPVPTYTAPEPPVTFTDQALQALLPKPTTPAEQDPRKRADAQTDAPGNVPVREEGRAVSPAAELPVQMPVVEPSLWLRPLFWCNQQFDSWTIPLGPLGRWLRAPAGRNLLGWTGLLLLAVACGLAVYDWFGWTR
jgi:hypothetical protein